jgi:imidazolonepropionase-like amidohydrolase
MASPRDIKPPPAAMANLRKVWDAGIPVVMGTDAGNIGTLHGPSVFREMELMVRAGLTPLEVLRTATANGARAMNRDMGTLDPGKLADLVILDADPTKDVLNLSKIHRVMKNGVVFDPKTLLRP